MGQRVSSGQAAANALGDFLRTQLLPSVEVRTKWISARMSPKNVVTIVPIGKRAREDVVGPGTNVSSVALTVAGAQNPTQRIVTRLGYYMQPIQLDVWCSSYDERDELVDMLDDALTQGINVTCAQYLQANGGYEEFGAFDPIRDGILLPLREQDGYTGFVDVLLDEPETTDTPDSMARSEYRATYYGNAQGEYARTRIVPRVTTLTFAGQAYDSQQAGTPYNTVTFTQNVSPPPAVSVVFGSVPTLIP